jgi:cytochrome c peroxidase
MMGAPTVIVEKLPKGDEIVKAFQALESYLGRKIDYTMPIEAGGMNGGGMMCQGQLVGGLFWDGRATGWTLGDPLAEQAMGPFLNPLEMNSPNPKLVCLKVRESVCRA